MCMSMRCMHRVPIFTIFCDKLGSGPIFRELSELTRKRQRPTWRRSEATCPDISDIARYFPIWADILRYSRYPPITRDSVTICWKNTRAYNCNGKDPPPKNIICLLIVEFWLVDLVHYLILHMVGHQHMISLFGISQLKVLHTEASL